MKLHRWVATLAASLLCACGGGGGGSGAAGGNFTLDTHSLSYAANYNGAWPPTQVAHMHLTDNGTSYVGAGFRHGPDPGWLSVNITGAPPDFDVEIQPNNTGLPEGSYSTILSVGTADAHGKVLHVQDISVSYVIQQVVDITSPPVDAAFTFGHSTTQQTSQITVSSSASDQYTATSDVGWLAVPATTYTGPGSVPATIDVTGLGVGDYIGTVTVHNVAKPTETDSVTFTVHVVPPHLSVNAVGLTLGGSDGLSLAGTSFGFALDTGTASHPWTATLTTSDGASWLLASSASGSIDGSGTTLGIDADRSKVKGGSYSGSVRIDVDVAGYALSQTVPVTLNKEAERLYVMADGVAFTKLPSRQLLTRSVQVVSTQGRAGVPWTASSNAAWLSATASGTTGNGVTLTADPTGLAVDAVHIATVTLASSDTAIENTQSIRVALWIGSQDSVPVTLPGPFKQHALNPVEPLLYAHNGTNSISVFNVHTGALVTTFAAGNSYPGAMTLSSDGLTLFVGNTSTGAVNALKAADGTPIRTYVPPSANSGTDVAYARPDALPTLFFAGLAADVATGTYFGTPVISGISAITADSRTIYLTDTGVSGATIYRQQIRRSALNGGQIVSVSNTSFSWGGNGQDVAVSPDGARVYHASGGYYAFPVFDGATRTHIADLPAYPYPDNVEVAWNGVLVGGAEAYYDDIDVWVYDAAGEPLGTLRCSSSPSNWFAPHSIRISGDGMRLTCGAGPDPYTVDTFKIRDIPGW